MHLTLPWTQGIFPSDWKHKNVAKVRCVWRYSHATVILTYFSGVALGGMQSEIKGKLIFRLNDTRNRAPARSHDFGCRWRRGEALYYRSCRRSQALSVPRCIPPLICGQRGTHWLAGGTYSSEHGWPQIVIIHLTHQLFSAKTRRFYKHIFHPCWIEDFIYFSNNCASSNELIRTQIFIKM